MQSICVAARLRAADGALDPSKHRTTLARSIMLALAWLLLGLVVLPTDMAAAQAEDPFAPTPVRVVILVDETKSLDDAALVSERTAAAALAGEIGDGLEVKLSGFGTVLDQAQSPNVRAKAVRQYCPAPGAGTGAKPSTGEGSNFALLEDSSSRTAFEQCAQAPTNLRRIGDTTNYVAALDDAIDHLIDVKLADPTDRKTSLVFLLTDGKLDVEDDPEYSSVPDVDARTEAALDDLRMRVLPRAKDAGIQLWPLGFGEADEGALSEIAQGGAPSPCSGDSPRPRVVKGDDPAGIRLLVAEAIASARCLHATEVDIPAYGSHVANVPAFATDVSFRVFPTSGRPRISFADPDGKPLDGSSGDVDGQRYRLLSDEVDGRTTLVVVGPKPGPWSIRLDGDGAATTLISWQNRVVADVDVRPLTPAPGQHLTVLVRPRTRAGTQLSPEDLAHLLVQVEAAHGGGAPAVAITLNDAGANPDERADDGVYTGEVVPETCDDAIDISARIDITATAQQAASAGPAVAVSVSCARGGSDSLQFSDYPLAVRIRRGDVLGGSILVKRDRPEFQPALVTNDLPDGVEVVVDPPLASVPVGAETRVRYEVHFGQDVALGRTTLRLLLRDQEAAVDYDSLVVDVEVARTATLWERWRGLVAIVIAGALVGGGAAVTVHRRRSHALRWSSGYLLNVRTAARETIPFELPQGRDHVRFVVADSPHLDRPTIRMVGDGDQTAILPFVLRSTGRHTFELEAPDGTCETFGLGQWTSSSPIEVTVQRRFEKAAMQAPPQVANVDPYG